MCVCEREGENKTGSNRTRNDHGGTGERLQTLHRLQTRQKFDEGMTRYFRWACLVNRTYVRLGCLNLTLNHAKLHLYLGI